jgi:hypothetical protein
MSEQVIIVPGDPGYVGACITDDGRPDPSHCWMRAITHIFQFKTLRYFVQLEAATTCRHMAEAIQKIPRPPRRAPVKWGWGKGWPGIR